MTTSSIRSRRVTTTECTPRFPHPAGRDASGVFAEENQNRFEQGLKLVETLYAFADGERQALVDKREAAAKKWYEEHNLPYKDEKREEERPGGPEAAASCWTHRN